MRIKEILFSESGMKVVNTLFFLAMLFNRSGFMFIAYAAWMGYLSFCIKNTESIGSKVIYSIFIGLASTLICISLYFMICE